VAGRCEFGDEPYGSGATKLVRHDIIFKLRNLAGVARENGCRDRSLHRVSYYEYE
jgi:hypothetical protein